jgi:hypothetical protein
MEKYLKKFIFIRFDILIPKILTWKLKFWNENKPMNQMELFEI